MRRAIGSPDTPAVVWLLALAAVYLGPALLHGASFGPFDLGSGLSGLGQGLYPYFHNAAIGDQIEEFIPWNAFDWTQLHHLRFPLWNPYSGLGMPQFFNFQSAVLSLPDLVSYLFPLRLAFLAAVATKLVLAGAGVYLFCRVVGLPALPSAFAATVFELGGPFVSEVGWPLADVMAWMGWILAFTWLALEQRPRAGRWACWLAVAVAFAVYGGFPEADLLLLGAYVVFFGALWACDRLPGDDPQPAPVLRLTATPAAARRQRRSSDLRALAAIGGGWAVGLLLAAPLWLPGAQLLAGSARLVLDHRPAIPLSALYDLFLQGYDGAPLHLDQYFGPFSYYETVAYVGVVALVLAGIALQRRRRGNVAMATIATAVALLIVGYDTGVFRLVTTFFPLASALIPGRARLPLSFMIAVLAGLGLRDLIADGLQPALRRAYRWSLAAVSAAVVGLWVDFLLNRRHMEPAQAAIRARSFAWPLALLAALALLDVAWGWAARAWTAVRRSSPAGWTRVAAAGLLVAEAGFLLSAGIGLNSYSRRFFPASAAETRLAAIVGPHLVGMSSDGGNDTRYGGLGIIPEMNLAYGVHEFAIYDPMVPAAYFTAWAAQTKTPVQEAGWFVPAIPSASVARTFGVSYVLVPQDEGPPPPGLDYVAAVGDEDLFQVPGASRFSLLGADPGDRIVSARQTSGFGWTIQVDSSRPVTLVARLTDVPGWHATSDGRALAALPWAGVMQQVRLPAGRQTVRLWYWPPLFTWGLALALAGLLGAWFLVRARVEARLPAPQGEFGGDRPARPRPGQGRSHPGGHRRR